MINTRSLVRCTFIVALATVAACSSSEEIAEAPAAPPMPANWSVVSDQTFAPAEIKPISESLGGEVSALRNTLYDVEGKSIKLNTIVAATADDADRIYAAVGKMKPEEWFLRDDLIIYEFVGNNDVIPEMRAGRALLANN